MELARCDCLHTPGSPNTPRPPGTSTQVACQGVQLNLLKKLINNHQAPEQMEGMRKALVPAQKSLIGLSVSSQSAAFN